MRSFSKCHPDRFEHADGMCMSCYGKHHYKQNRERLLELAKCRYKQNRSKILKRCALWAEQNPDKVRKKSREWRRLNKDRINTECRQQYRKQSKAKRLDRTLRKSYKITYLDYKNMLKAQNNACAICSLRNGTNGPHKRLFVDHDHETGVVRGLVCNRCNVMLGYLGDVQLLEKAQAYLEKAKNKPLTK